VDEPAQTKSAKLTHRPNERRILPAARGASQQSAVNTTQSSWVLSGEHSRGDSVAASIEDLTPTFLEGLSPEEVKVVLAAATELQFPVGAVLLAHGSRAEHLYLLIEGRARYFFTTEDGRKLILLWLPPGSTFGVSSLLPRPSCYLASVETVKPSYALMWKRSTIRDLAERYPRLTENTLTIGSDYMSIYVATHVALTSQSARRRLAGLLTNLAWGFGRKTAEGIELDVTNEDLASAANVTHFTASRLLSEWSHKGILAKKRGKILLHFPEKLAHVA
jgi:CRP/FNR family transcriptional regulator, nitrogen oxide reductase regulator